MKIIESFKEYLITKANLQKAKDGLLEILSREALEEAGRVLLDVLLVAKEGQTLIFECPSNNSKFRKEEEVEIVRGEIKRKGKIALIENNGKTIKINESIKELELGDKVDLREKPFKLTGKYIECLLSAQPGYPGWSHLSLFEFALPAMPVLEETPNLGLAGELLKSLETEAGKVLDSSQKAALLKAVPLPLLLGIQGPPGTGKTQALAFLAELLVRMGNRVMILSVTHQATNNALSAIKQMFPKRPIFKAASKDNRESLHPNIEICGMKTLLDENSREELNQTIIGCTMASVLSQQSSNSRNQFSPTVMLIDEAGQVPFVEGMLLSLLGAGSLILFGDDAQMSPVFEDELMTEPHAISMFAGLRKFYPKSITPLNVTYRLNSRLCDLIGRNFYGPEVGLHSHPSNADLMFPYEIAPKGSKFLTEVLDPTLSIVWMPVDTVDCGEENEEEARTAVQIIKACMEGGVPVKEMVLVTPFRRQSARIRDMLQEATGTHLLPVIDTVERVQGMTVDLVIYSLCSSDHELLQTRGSFLFSLNRLNVALSRARTKVVILASPHALNCLPSSFDGFKARNTFRSILAFDCKKVDPEVRLLL